MPQAAREWLHVSLVALGTDAVLNDRIRLLGGQYVASTPEAFAGRICADIARWRALAGSANIQAE